jgi:hypothetical protein
MEVEHPYLQAVCLALFSWGLFVLPPLAAALVICRVYRRNALGLRWPLIACLLLSFIAALLDYS